ncbi:predicted protein [Sclerotinia sclerotiorum 1980 UF-70]|uniref:Uncharacterized protein n=1 Tax=Sclerotinia sclerotiorum (strain ATCC 18683 / 1980 / Ss-1) TaxID=665079 RepID=A7EC33_SCLS1|nr:predicted protein [Sclerotinia sclerotiorum 1980 UF-70]EDO00012.1 predicted protein [Sclerotinia sclerotiorum 1980 UF-70]
MSGRLKDQERSREVAKAAVPVCDGCGPLQEKVRSLEGTKKATTYNGTDRFREFLVKV